MANLYFSNEVLSGNVGGVKFIKLFGRHNRLALVSQATTALLIAIKIGDTNFVGDTMFYEGWMSDIVQIERNFALSHSFIFLTGDGKIRRTPRIGTIDNFEQYLSQSIRCSYIALLPIIHEYLCIGISDNKLYKINANTGASEAMNVGQVTCVQNHKGKIYALQQGKRAIFVREGDKWLTYAQPVSQKTIKSFKMIFNGEIYAQFDGDKHVYQWTGNDDKWTDVSRQDCEPYEVEREFICVISNGSFVYHHNFVPQPSLHFPFKHQNGTRIPYGRGTDDNGKQYVDLTASVNHAEIGIDQFGKGYVLASSYERVVLGKFDDNHFSQPIGRALTITCWVCLVLLDAYNGGSFSPFWTVKNINGKEQGIHLYITEKQGFNNVLELAQNVLRLFINGTSYGARRSFPYSHNFIMNAAIHNGKGGYFSDLAIWDLPLNDHQIKHLVKSDMEIDEWRRDLNFVTARSCEELQRQQPYTISGYYWVFHDNKYKPVWCDMKTDGGGWTRISYLTEDKKSTEAPVHNLDESNILTDHWVTGVLLKHLYNIYPFKQIRFACDAPGGLRMDFATPLEQWEEVIDYFVKEESNDRINVCDLEIMEIDNSYLSYDDFDCSKFTDKYVGKEGIANDRIFQLLFSY
uniref:Fibrinogen C-terminal domain-containing protein n=2 Tax=Clytia hemisphaerica TaxID=252671 RepID=A0A7M5WYN9_9CNID